MEVLMKRLLSSVLLASISVAFSGIMAGCSASASVDPDRAQPASSSDTYYKKTTTTDANGNVVERKVETKRYD
jgi:hypothetical protein